MNCVTPWSKVQVSGKRFFSMERRIDSRAHSHSTTFTCYVHKFLEVDFSLPVLIINGNYFVGGWTLDGFFAVCHFCLPTSLFSHEIASRNNIGYVSFDYFCCNNVD